MRVNNIHLMQPDMARLYKAVDLLYPHFDFKTDLGRLLQESEQTLKNWEKRGIPGNKLLAICRSIGHLNPYWIETGEGNMRIDDKPVLCNHAHDFSQFSRGNVPILCWQAVDYHDSWSPCHVPAEDYLFCPIPHGQRTYALKITQDCMNAITGKSYPPGSIIFVEPDFQALNVGDRVIARLPLSDQVVFRVYMCDPQRTWLEALNDEHPVIRGSFHIMGKVIGKWEQE